MTIVGASVCFVVIVPISTNRSGAGAIFAAPVLHFPTILVQCVDVSEEENHPLAFRRYAIFENHRASCHDEDENDQEIEAMASKVTDSRPALISKQKLSQLATN
jgi:hypothetical protein